MIIFDIKSSLMSATDIRQKLHHYIETAQDKKVKAIFAMVEEEIEETYGHWQNKTFIAELNRREQGYLNGTTRTYTLDQTVSRAKRTIKKAKKS